MEGVSSSRFLVGVEGNAWLDGKDSPWLLILCAGDGTLLGHEVSEGRPTPASALSLMGDLAEPVTTNLSWADDLGGRLVKGAIPPAVAEVALELVTGIDEPAGPSDCERCSGTGSTSIVLEGAAAEQAPARLLTGLACCCLALSESRDVTAPMLRATLTSVARFGATTAWAYFSSETIFQFRLPWLPGTSFYVTVSGGTGMAPPGLMVTDSWALACFDGAGSPPAGVSAVRVSLTPRRSTPFADIRFTEGGRLCPLGGPDATLVTRDVDGEPLWADVSLVVFGDRGRAEYSRPRPSDLAVLQAAARVVTHAAGSREHRSASLPFSPPSGRQAEGAGVGEFEEEEPDPVLITENIPAVIYPSTSPCSISYTFPLTPDPSTNSPVLPVNPRPPQGASAALDAARLAIAQALRWLSLSSRIGDRATALAVQKVKEVMVMSRTDFAVQRLLAHTVWEEALEALGQSNLPID